MLGLVGILTSGLLEHDASFFAMIDQGANSSEPGSLSILHVRRNATSTCGSDQPRASRLIEVFRPTSGHVS